MSDEEVTAALRGLGRTRDRVLDGAAIRAGDAVLEVGAGIGLLALGAVERVGGDGDVFAVDVSVDALQELRRSAGAPTLWYLLGEAEVLPLPDAFVDVALMRSVLIAVRDVEAAVQELCRVLRSGGRLSLFEPLNGRATSMHEVKQLDADSLVDAVSHAGFADVRANVEAHAELWLTARVP
jgi:ubiquinone/menaquinone biosynthesis C-methylase UbiE